MCGIGGWRRFGNAPPVTTEQVELLLTGLQARGNDATGIALQDAEGHVDILKHDEPAYRFITEKKTQDWLAEKLPTAMIITLHTRAATKGNPRKQVNNHPLFSGHSAIVHNGIIHNDDFLFREAKLERSAETDSDIIRAILDKDGFTKKGIRQLGRISGSMAISAISVDAPGKLLLVRSGNPLVLAEKSFSEDPDSNDDLLIWASEKSFITKAMRPWVKKLGLEFQAQATDLRFLTMADNSAWLFNEHRLEWHDECKTCSYFTEPKRHLYDNYEERQRKWDAANGAKEITVRANPEGSKNGIPCRIKCPTCQTFNKRSLPEVQGRALADLECGHCHSRLAQIA